MSTPGSHSSGTHAKFSWLVPATTVGKGLLAAAVAVITGVVSTLIAAHLQAGKKFAETAGSAAQTSANPYNGGLPRGPLIGKGQTVHVSCRIRGLKVPSGNTWWYRVADSPWNDKFYVSADAFFNNGKTRGSLVGTPFVDRDVDVCKHQ